MLGRGATLPGGCAWLGASIQQDRVVAQYSCPGVTGRLTLTLLYPDAAPRDAPRTRRFAFGAQPSFPDALLHEIQRRVRAREGAWIWTVGGTRPVADPRGRVHPLARPPPLIVVVLWLTAMLGIASATALGVDRKRRGAALVAAAREPPSTYSVLLSGIALMIVGVLVGQFRFVYDDYRYLERAIARPWRWDDSLRFLSTSALFRGIALVSPHGSPSMFILANLSAFTAAIVCWCFTLRRAGFGIDETLVAGGLFALSPGAPELLRRAAGIENLSVAACIFAILAVIQSLAAPQPVSRLRLTGGLCLVTALAGAGVFLKYPFMVVVPPAAWLWWRGVARIAPTSLLGHAVPVVLSTAIGVPVALGLQKGNVGMIATFGTANVVLNLELAWQAIYPWLAAASASLAVLVVWRLADTTRRADGARGAALRAEAKRTARAAIAAATSRVGAVPLVVLAVALGALFLAPTLFHLRYYSAEYVLLASAPLAALLARVIVRAGAPERAPWGVGVIALLLLVPFGAVARPDPSLATERAQPWLRDFAARIAAGRFPEPDRLAFVSVCPSPADNPASDATMHELLRVTGRAGIDWATGWRATALASDADPGGDSVITVQHCAGRIASLSLRRESSRTGPGFRAGPASQ